MTEQHGDASTRPTTGPAAARPWRVFTLPNLVSAARLLGVPLFLYLVLVTHADLAALIVLIIGGSSDWVDGQLARRLGQVSRLGQLLDPTADRLYIVATVLALTVRDIVPWQLAGLLLLREVVVGASLPVLARYGYGPPPVHFLGKAATFVLLVAFPALLLASFGGTAESVFRPVGWSLAVWGTALYWCAGALYLVQADRLVRAARRAGAAAVGT